MKDILIATAQFEHRSGDKKYNLGKIEELAIQAKNSGARMVCFHELSIPGYSFLKDLNRKEIDDVSEELSDSYSVKILQQISSDLGIIIMAGLVEKNNGKYFNTYLVIENDNIISKFSKLHPFINENLSAGNEYVFFTIDDWICSILICYDNNIIENVRAVSLSGTQLLIAPHVTGGTPSPMPGRGWIERDKWENRHRDTASIMAEINGPKGREWLMKWLPARAYDNGIYVAFSNAVGMDHDHIKNGNSMIIDPFGDILNESIDFNDQIVMASLSSEKLKQSGGFRYRNARRPELYKDIINSEHDSYTRPVWMQ